MLARFRHVVGCGQIFGPYRGYLYYWRTHDVAIISSVLVLMWPWLSTERRAQFGKTIDAVPALWMAAPFGELLASRWAAPGDDETHRAWAAGFFEGDGTIGAYPTQRGVAARRLMASISQASESGVPTVLTRFRDVAHEGSIYGPIMPRGWSKLPQYRWQARGASAARIATMLLPWLAGPKRAQVLRALEEGR